MENKKQTNKLLITLIIIIICLVLSGGYTIYALLSNTDNNTGTNNNIDSDSNLSDGNSDQIDGENNTSNDQDVNDNIISKEVIDSLDGNITVEKVIVTSKNEYYEYYLLYTKKDKKGKTLWTYKTQKDRDGQQYTYLRTMRVEDTLYIDEKGTIVNLSKETGKILWTWKYNHVQGPRLADVEHVDSQGNTYITNGFTLIVLDKNGKIKANKEYTYLDLTDASCSFRYINENEGYIFGVEKFILINLKDYKETLKGTYEYSFDNDHSLEIYNLLSDGKQALMISIREELKSPKNYVTKKYYEWGQYDKVKISKITKDRVYIDEYGTITVLNKETGKTLWTWKYNNGPHLADVEHVDSQGNTYITNGFTLIVLDKNGQQKKSITYEELTNIDFNLDGNCDFVYINEKEAILSNGETTIYINLTDYSVKTTK